MSRFNIDDRKIISSISLGSQNLTGVVAHTQNENIEVLSCRDKKSLGFQDGQIVDFESVSCNLKSLIEELECESGISLSEASLCINGDFKIHSSKGMALINPKEVDSETLYQLLKWQKRFLFQNLSRCCMFYLKVSN